MARIAAEIVGRIKRHERLRCRSVGGIAFDVQHAEHLVVERAHAVRHDQMLGVAVRQGDKIRPAAEQIDRGRTEQRQVIDTEICRQRRLAAGQQQHDVDFVAGTAHRRPV